MVNLCMMGMPAGCCPSNPHMLLTPQKLSSELALAERGHQLHCWLLGMHRACGGWAKAF